MFIEFPEYFWHCFETDESISLLLTNVFRFHSFKRINRFFLFLFDSPNFVLLMVLLPFLLVLLFLFLLLHLLLSLVPLLLSITLPPLFPFPHLYLPLQYFPLQRSGKGRCGCGIFSVFWERKVHYLRRE